MRSNNIRSTFFKIWMVIDVCFHQLIALVWIWSVFNLQKVKLQLLQLTILISYYYSNIKQLYIL